MMKSLILFFTLIISTQANAQHTDTILLQPVSRIDIIYELPLAALGFNKKDFLKEYEQFKIDYAIGFKKDSIVFEDAIAFLKKSKKRIVVQENNNSSSVLFDLERIIKQRLAVGLLVQGKASVVRKGSGKREKAVALKQSLDMSDNSTDYSFEFVGESEFLEAKFRGEVIEMVEDVAFVEPQPPIEAAEFDSSKLFYVVEISPEPKGGLTAFKDYLEANLKYPHEAKTAGIEGKVFVQFWVNADGTLEKFTIAKGLREDMDAEAIRLIKEGPPWKAGKQNGKLVKSSFVFPVTFKIAR